MESDDFVMPKLNLLLSKQTQIDVVQEVREQANTAYTHLQEQTGLICKLMGQQGDAPQMSDEYISSHCGRIHTI